MSGGDRVGVGPTSGGDRAVLNHFVLLVGLAGFIGGVYLLVVVGLGSALNSATPNTGLSVVAMTLVALTFGGVRRAVQRLADRITHEQGVTPEVVLERFSSELADTTDHAQALSRMSQIVAEGVGATHAEVWLRAGDELFRAAAWPPAPRLRGPRLALPEEGPPSFARDQHAVPVEDGGDLVGAIVVAAPPGSPLPARAAMLLEDLASQAGIVLRNVRLTAELSDRLHELEAAAVELRASRRRIVEAQDAERRRLERDIHDGAQQHLVALAVKLRMARMIAERDPDRTRTLIGEVRGLTEGALENLRDLTRGIYPPVLAAEGVTAALRAHTSRAGIRITISGRDIDRMHRAAEAAIYFCCLEAIQNAAKHARARRLRVRLERAGPEVVFSVADDGAGFDPATTTRVSGLQNMRDRLAVVGGRLEIHSAPGEGTTVTGRVPVRLPEAVA